MGRPFNFAYFVLDFIIMNHIYTTKAFVIKSTPLGEANKTYFLFTKDLGFIKATAQSVRLDKSKLKGHLQDLSLINISLVKGKEIWRIVSAEAISQELFIKNFKKLLIVKNIFSLLLRLIHGEDKNEPLFDCIESFYNFIVNNDLTDDNLKNLETIVVLRILYYLGYFKKSFDLSDFVKNNDLTPDLFNLFKNKRKSATVEINDALNETHL